MPYELAENFYKNVAVLCVFQRFALSEPVSVSVEL